MASPLQPGGFPMSAVSSKDIDILKEDIQIKIDKYFQKAAYRVKYTIRNEQAGVRIPLLFQARDYYNYFRVWLDGKRVELKEIDYLLTDTVRFNQFSNNFKHTANSVNNAIEIPYDKQIKRSFPLSDFRYFEVNLSKGTHQILVEYTGKVWIDHSGWLNEYSFRYFLAPAKEWKSFHELNVYVDASAFDQSIHSNLSSPDSGSFKGTAYWKFSEIPADYIQITFSPKPNAFAKFLISIGPLIIAIVFILLILIMHISLIRYTRKKALDLLARSVIILGSLIFPLFILLSFGFAYEWIDYTIGTYAGRHQGGYIFILIYLYIFLMPLYWIGMNRIGLNYKKRFAAKS